MSNISVKLYSESVKSYQYFGNILYSSMATFTVMFLVNDKLVWNDKTVPQILELWCM